MLKKITDEDEKDAYLHIGENRLNGALHMIPADSDNAENYGELYQLWKEIHNRSVEGEWRNPNDAEFKKWDEKVLAILSPEERERYDKPLRPHLAHIPECASGAPTSRSFHLTKILWARQGLEKYMKNTGY